MARQKKWKPSPGVMVVSGVQKGIMPDITKAEEVMVGKARHMVFDAGQGTSYVWSTGEVFLVNGRRMPDQGVSYVFERGGFFISQPFLVFYHKFHPGPTGDAREPMRTCQCQGSERVMHPVDCKHIKAVKILGKDKPHQSVCRSYPEAYPCLRIILAQL